MSLKYDRWVGIIVSEENAEQANLKVASITENPEDLKTFKCKIIGNNKNYMVTQIPMRNIYFDSLPDFQNEIGGEWVELARRTDQGWQILKNIYDWIEELGYTLVVNEEEF
jgi:hypothetical protein